MPGTRRIGLVAVAQARMRLGDALRAQGRNREAIPVMQQSLDEYEQSDGVDSQGAITALSRLSHLYSLVGDKAKAIETEREVYASAARHWGAGSQFALIELINLGSDEHDAGDLQSALSHLEQAEAGLVKVSGPRSAVVQATREEEAETLSDLGRNEQALAMLAGLDPAALQATTSDPGQARS